jgi:tetratricopeptide (TPR) repeat protein
MARAAAKRNRGTRQAARPVTDDRARKRKAERSVEDQLFFSRLRGHAKWAFGLLALVFGLSFVFLGVGSGNAGLGDVFSSVFGGGSAPSISSLRDKVAESPLDRTAVVDLAQAYERDGRTDEAIATYRTYLVSRPKDVEMLNNLALVYQSRADAAAGDANAALRELSLAAPAAQFRPGTGLLGQALASQVDPLAQAASTEAETAYQEALDRYRAANREALGIYQRLARLDPNEPSSLLRYAQAAVGADDLERALGIYQQFVKRFPQDPLVADAKRRIKELKKQVAAQAASTSADQASGQTG